MPAVHLVALLSIVQFFFFGALVGRQRVKTGVLAPAMSGHPMFERALRVQMNTLEQLAVFLPSLLIAAQYQPPHWVAALGAVYLVARLLYWRAYMADPTTRTLGFALTAAASLTLAVLGLWGAVRAL